MEQENNCLCCCWGQGEEQEPDAPEGPCSMGFPLGGNLDMSEGEAKGEETSCEQGGSSTSGERWAGLLCN